MKKTILIFLLQGYVLAGFSQAIIINRSSVATPINGISDEYKEQILDRSEQLFNKYIEYAKMDDESDHQDFQDLFSDEYTIRIFNDLELDPVPGRLKIETDDYADVLQRYFLLEGGLEIEVKNVRFGFVKKEMDYYSALIYFDKLTNSKIPRFEDALKYDQYQSSMILKIQVDVFDEDETGVKIASIKGESKDTKKIAEKNTFKVERPSYISLYGVGSFGTLSNNNPIQGEANYMQNSSSFSSFGGGIEYHRHLSDRLLLNVRAGGEIATLSTELKVGNVNIDGLTGSSRPQDINVLFLDVGNSGEFLEDQPRESEFKLNSISEDGSPGAPSEVLDFSMISGYLGVDYILHRGNYESKFFVGVGTQFTYHTIGVGKLRGIFEGNNVPIDPNFPDFTEFNGDIPEVYRISEAGEDVESGSGFSIGAVINPTYHHSVSSFLGISLGLDLIYDMTPFFNNLDPIIVDGADIPNQGWLFDENSTTFSVSNPRGSFLEDHFISNKLLRFNLRAGVFFTIGG